MTADEFSAELKSLTPKAEDLRELGLTPEEIERHQKMNFCSRNSKLPAQDPLVDLCTNFDVSTLEIASITFCPINTFDSDHWHVGYDESVDPIIVSRSGDSVEARDHEDLERTSVTFAKSSSGFLAALIVAQRLLSRCPFEPEKRSRGEERFLVLNECVSLAGGEECRKFYRSLLIDEPPGLFRRLMCRPINWTLIKDMLLRTRK